MKRSFGAAIGSAVGSAIGFAFPLTSEVNYATECFRATIGFCFNHCGGQRDFANGRNSHPYFPDRQFSTDRDPLGGDEPAAW